MVKSIFASKTFWFSVAELVFAAVGYFTGWVDQSTAFALLVAGCAGVGLRFNTSQPVSVTGK